MVFLISGDDEPPDCRSSKTVPQPVTPNVNVEDLKATFFSFSFQRMSRY